MKESPPVDGIVIHQALVRASVLERCREAWRYYVAELTKQGVPVTKHPSFAAFIGQGLILRGLESFEETRAAYEASQQLVKAPTEQERQVILAGGRRA